MNKIKTSFLLLVSSLLISCQAPTQDNSESSSSPDSIESESSEVLSESEESIEVSSESESSEEIIPPAPVSGAVDLYAINDFHGSVEVNEDNYEMGILKVGSYLKQRQQEDNTVVINSGDYWQGSIQSNLNYGEFLTKVSNEIEFDAMTIGNHEFDWGVEYIERNAALKDEDTNYQTPLLGANIYNYDINTGKVGEYANLGEKYVIKTLANGIKVGIIGLIGEGQISSITSTFVDHLTFIKPLGVVKELSQTLRNKGCHVVVLSAHEAVADIATIKDGSGNSLYDYVDVIFGAHTHRNETKLYDNRVPGVQGSYNGRSISKISIDVALDGKISVKEYKNYNNSTLPNVEIDAGIKEIYDEYTNVTKTLANEELAETSQTISKNNAPYFMTASLANYAMENSIKIDYAVVNQARNDLGEDTTITYEDLYRAFPFDNEVFVVEVKGSELSYNLNKNYFYRLDPNALDHNKTYTCAIIDYVALHRNNNRQYDNFTQLTIKNAYNKAGVSLYNYRDICADWLRGLEENTVIDTTNYFIGSSLHHNKSFLGSNVTLPNNPYVG